MDSFNSSIEKTSNTNSPYLKVNYDKLFWSSYLKLNMENTQIVILPLPLQDMMDLNTELTGYFSRYWYIQLRVFWEIPFLSLADDVICFCVCRTYPFLLMLKSWNSFPQPDRQCKHPRPVWLLVHLFLRVRALLQRVPFRDLPQGFDLGNKLFFINYYSSSRRKSGPSSSLLPTTSCTTTSRRSWSSSTTTRSTILLEWKMSQLLHNVSRGDIFFGKMF